jgi:hypothetical protein
MKLSIFTTITSPNKRGDTWRESITCYEQLADEVIVVDGDKQFEREVAFMQPTNVSVVDSEWPKEFSWEFIGQQFQRGYETCTGDWVIHADLDFIFHERDYRAIRMACENNPEAPALSFWKHQFVLPDRYNLKSRLVIAVNKGKFGDRIRFDGGGESDLCQPSLDGEYIKPADVPEAQIPFYNYEKILKTRQQIADDQGRMERAYFRHFGKTQYGSDGTDEGAYNNWIEAQKGKFNKPQKFIKLTDHPKVMQETIKNLTVDQWGYSGHGYLEENKYV